MNELISLLDPSDPKERCGLVMADGTIAEITNIHPEPEQGFHMNPAELVLLVDDAVATWHTHPSSDPALSGEDYEGFCQWENLVHHIVGVRNGEPAVETYQVVNGLVFKS